MTTNNPNPNTHPHREIIQAWLDGREVEYSDGEKWYTQGWDDAEFPDFLNYRIKEPQATTQPEPKPEPSRASGDKASARTWYQAVIQARYTSAPFLSNYLCISKEDFQEVYYNCAVLKLIPVYTEESPE